MNIITELSQVAYNQQKVEPIELQTPHEEGTSSALRNQISKNPDFIEETNAELNDNLLDDNITYPDGGLKAYLVVFGALMSLMMTFGLMNSVGGIQAYIASHQLSGISESTIGWIFSVYFFIALGGVIFTGPLFDAKGAPIPMGIGSVFIIVGLFISANCTKVYQFILGFGLIVGIGTSFLLSASMGAVTHWFNKNRGTAVGICSIGGSLGGVIWPLMLRELYPKIGYAWTMRILAFASVFCLGLGCLLVKHRNLKPSEEVIKSPKRIIKSSFVLREFFTEKRFLFMGISIFLCEISLILTTTYMASYTMHSGYTESEAFMVLIVSNAVGISGRYVPNYFADRWGRINVVVVTVFCCCVLIFGLWLPFGHNLKAMYAFSGLYGFFSASTLSLAPVCVGQISKIEDFGKRYGTIYSLVSIGTLICIPIGGAIIGGSNGYRNLILLIGATEAAATVTWILTRYYIVGTKLKCWV